MDMDGSRLSAPIVSSVASDHGTFPRFDATRQRVTLIAGSASFGGTPNLVIVADTSGATRRDSARHSAGRGLLPRGERSSARERQRARRRNVTSDPFGGGDGTIAIANANGTGKRSLGSTMFSPGIAWSPDGLYLVGRASVFPGGLRVVGVSDGVSVALRAGFASSTLEDYYQPDWR